jgi:hypothetical protein
MDRYEDDEKTGNIIVASKTRGTIKEYQTVVEVGPNVRDVKPGDKIMIDPKRFAVVKHQEGSLKDGVISDNPVISYKFDVVTMHDTDYLLLQDRDILYIFEGEEEEEKPKSNLYTPELIV